MPEVEEQANLGLATTQQLVTELETRIRMGHGDPDYRTVDKARSSAVFGYTDARNGRANALNQRAQRHAFSFSTDNPTITQAVGEAIGAGSVCFEKGTVPTGPFDDKFASSIVDVLLYEIERYVQTRIQQDRREKFDATLAPHTMEDTTTFKFGPLRENLRNALHMGVEQLPDARYSVELRGTRFDVWANGLKIGELVDQHGAWYWSTERRIGIGSISDMVRAKLAQIKPPDTDELSSVDVFIVFTEPDLTVPETADDDDEDIEY